MKLSIIISVLVYISLNGYGLSIQFIDTLNKSNSGELASILNAAAFFSSPLPLYLVQFIAVSVLASLIFITSQHHFSMIFARLTKRYINNQNYSQFIWIIIANVCLLIVNAAYFHHSSHLVNTFYFWPEHHPNIFIATIIILFPIVYYFTTHISSKKGQVSIGLFVIFISLFYFTKESSKSNSVNQNSEPNIIVIGIDSLRSDLMKTQMPFLNKMLRESVIFETAISPLGRTYPAWNTILTGLYPVNHGARINLIGNNHLVGTHHYLPSILKEKGYQSYFAIDETRFANLGVQHGFDKTITPRMGASDFLITSISDIPVVNLLSLFDFSRWLLPEIYANRGAAKTYRPQSFVNLINRELPAADKPTFLAAHFCLAHWPYIFSTKEKPYSEYVEPYYPLNLQAVDKQIEALFEILDNKGYLSNSRIVFLSDHGETWLSESPHFTDKANPDDVYRFNEYGHGSSLTSSTSRVLLAFNNFKTEESLFHNRQKLASLADITPTILSDLSLETGLLFDGEVLSTPDLADDKITPIETGTILRVDESNKLNLNNIIGEFLNRYKLNSDGLLTIHDHQLEAGFKAKEYGLTNSDSVLHSFNDGSFKLFNLQNSNFSTYDDFQELSDKQNEWALAWCHYYKKERKECLSQLPN